ncbi:MAG: DUF5652 family protein [Candidatus Woesearchaeota archaeon]
MEPLRTSVLVLIFIIALIDLVLKGLALYKSARRGQSGWFVALLILNTAGILPAIYLLWFSKKVKR